MLYNRSKFFEDKEMIRESGTITVFAGPMFSRKSEELIKEIRDHQRARMRVLVIKPVTDTRTKDCIKARRVVGKKIITSDSIRAFPVSLPHDVLDLVDRTHCDVVAADEIQFFRNSFIWLFTNIAWEMGKIVLLSGLDTDFRKKPFRITADLLACADYTIKTTASCFDCGKSARFTQKKSGDPKKRIQIGNKGYEARCRHCHVMPEDLGLGI